MLQVPTVEAIKNNWNIPKAKNLETKQKNKKK